MGNKDLIVALRNKFAPTVREMCADDKFDCDALCDGNILTSECIVFQAADAIEALEAELAAYRDLGPIAALTALVKAINEGRVVVLPCKVWETVHKAIKGTPLCSVEDSEKSSFLHAKKPPVVHAHITGTGYHLNCSNCKESADIGNDYCPHCGAKMEEGTNHETD